MADLLIKGGTVIDGTGAVRRDADVRVRNGIITEVGTALTPAGERVLDATGAYVTPGFIDVHTHLDPTLFWDPLADPMPQHGVTTVLTGNCSLSLMPVRPAHRQGVSDIFCYIEDMPAQTFADGIPWAWETYAEYRDALGGSGLGVNAASLVGHTALRLYVMGDEAWERAATGAERAAIARVLDDSMIAGAFGLSLTFFDTDANGRPLPGRMADDAELAALVDVVAAHHGVVQAGPASPEVLQRVVDMAAGRDLTMTWLGVFQADKSGLTAGILEQATRLQAEGVLAYPQFSPRVGNVTINWERTMAFMTLPTGWHRIVQASWDDRRNLLQDPSWRATARAEWDEVPYFIFPHRFPERVRLVSVARPQLDHWVGRTLADLIADRGGHPCDVLADWVLENDLDPGLMSIGDEDLIDIARLINHPATIVGASDAGAHVAMICASGDSTLLLARHVRDRSDLTLEDAVHQLTGRPARLFRMGDRGEVRPGAIADLTVFDLDELRFDDEAFVSDLPGGGRRLRRPEGGYRYTVVSGVTTQEYGQLTGARPATVLALAT